MGPLGKRVSSRWHIIPGGARDLAPPEAPHHAIEKNEQLIGRSDGTLLDHSWIEEPLERGF